MNKKAEMGIGTLIIFIAMILVAAIAAGVLLQTASSLQNKALLTGEKSKTQVSTGLITLQVYAEDGQTGQTAIFCQTLKLQPGSDPLKFEDALLNFDTNNKSSDKTYGNRTSADITCSRSNAHVNTGGSTSKYLSSGENCNAIVNSGIDFDGDGVYDNLSLNRSGNGLVIEVSNGSKPAENVTIKLVNEKNIRVGVNETVYNASDKINITVFDADVNDSKTSQWGAISIIAWNVGASTNMTIDSTKSFIIGAGSQATSAYSVEYLVTGSSYVSGYLNRGDVVSICYSSPRLVTEDEDISLSFVPKTGTISVIRTAMPDIMNQKRIYVYP